MKYPIITSSDCRYVAEQLNIGSSPNVQEYIKWLGTGDDLDRDRINEAAREIGRVLEQYSGINNRDRDRLEGRAAPILYEVLQDVDIAVLDDPGFWRYLSLVHFWRFIAWREEKAFARGNYLKYVDGVNSTECVLTRMYLRVQALGGNEYGSMAAEVPMATDFWRSHIIRVRTATAPSLTRAFVERQRDDRLNTPELRQFARRLNRTWTNILLNIYDDEEARQLIEELWTR